MLNIKDLSFFGEVGNVQDKYEQNLTEQTEHLKNNFEEKIGTSEADAIKKFREIMADLNRTLFISHPNHVRELGDVLKDYESALKMLHFTDKILSSPERVEAYGNRLKEQKERINNPAIAAHHLIVSENLIENCALGTKFVENFSEAMDKSFTKIKETHEKLDGEKKRTDQKLNELVALLQEDKEKINRLLIITDPKSGLSPSAVNAMIQGGIPKDVDLLDILGNINKEADAQAIEYLYGQPPQPEKVFELNPDDLSDGTYALLLGEVFKMIEENGPQPKLENLLNSLLEQPSSRVDKHLERLLANNDMISYQIAYLMATDETLSEEDKRALYETWEKFATLSGLWTAVYTMDRPDISEYPVSAVEKVNLKGKKSTKITGLKLSNLKSEIPGTPKIFRFKGEVEEFVEGVKNGTSKVTSYKAGMYPNAEGFDTKEAQGKYAELVKARDKLLKDLLKDTTVGAVGIFVPGFDKMIGVAEGLAKSDIVKSVKDMSKLKGDNKANKGKDFGKNAAFDMIEYIQKLRKSEEEISKANSEILNNLLGIGGIVVTSGKDKKSYPQLSPGVVESLEKLEKNGIKDFVKPGEFESIKEKLLKDDEDEELSKIDEKIKDFLLNGGKISDLDNYSDLADALEDIGDSKILGNPNYFEMEFTKNANKYVLQDNGE